MAKENDGEATKRTKRLTTTTTAGDASPTSTAVPPVQGGTKNSGSDQGVSAENQSSMTTNVMQAISLEVLTAPLSAETLIALASAIPGLTVPRREDCDEVAWQRDVYRPAQHLLLLPKVMQHLARGEHDRAWQYLEDTLRYMVTPGSPSWWQTQRARKTPILLRHASKEFATQLHDMTEKMEMHLWHTPAMLPYTGPAICWDYNDQLSGMSEEVATQLYNEIRTIHPELALALGAFPESPDLFAVGVQVGPGPNDYLDFYDPEEWHRRGAEIEEKVQMALAFAKALAEMNADAGGNQESQGPPGNN